jgi:hypothetical protein
MVVRCPSCASVWPRRADPARALRRVWTRGVPLVLRVVGGCFIAWFCGMMIITFAREFSNELLGVGLDPARVLEPSRWGSWLGSLDWEYVSEWMADEAWKSLIVCTCLVLFIGLFVKATFWFWGRWLWPAALGLLLLVELVPRVVYDFCVWIGAEQVPFTGDPSWYGFRRVAVVLTVMTMLMPLGGLIGNGLLRGARIRRVRRFVKFRKRVVESRPLRRLRLGGLGGTGGTLSAERARA